jgi:tol-pal system protein YbgF
MMRTGLAVLLLVAAPVHAQTDTLTPRVTKLEGEMRAVQRKVFPGGAMQTVAPEAVPTPPPPEPGGTPATSPVADLTARVDGLERQLRTLTGDVEALQFKQRQLEDQLAKFRADAEYRLGGLEAGKAPADAAPLSAKPGKPETLKPDTAKPDTGKTAATKPGATKADAARPDAAKTDPGMEPVEAAWRAAYAPVAAKDYDKAEPALLDFLSTYPKAPRAASAQYWLGRTYMGRSQPAQAAKAFLDGYKNYPKSDRAADSLLWLGNALTALKKPDQACRAYNELETVYGAKLTAAQKDAATKARATAKCDG